MLFTFYLMRITFEFVGLGLYQEAAAMGGVGLDDFSSDGGGGKED